MGFKEGDTAQETDIYVNNANGIIRENGFDLRETVMKKQ